MTDPGTTPDLLNPNPFANPIVAAEGDLVARDLYASVGLCIDRWEHCEVGFAVLYSSLIDAPENSFALQRSFGVAASATRREMISAATDARFLTDEWNGVRADVRHLVNIYGTAAVRRNEIAHGAMEGDVPTKLVDGKVIPLPTIWFWAPPIFSTRKISLSKEGGPRGGPFVQKFRYSSKEIDHFTRCFEELSSRAFALARVVRNSRG